MHADATDSKSINFQKGR